MTNDNLSIFDLFTIGVGPSSSHSVGPMRAGNRFVDELKRASILEQVSGIQVELYGSLALTGIGHGTDKAVQLGLQGETPEGVDPDGIEFIIGQIRASQQLKLPDGPSVAFDPDTDLILQNKQQLPAHPNGMRFTAFDGNSRPLHSQVYYSIGGGFVVNEAEAAEPVRKDSGSGQPFPFSSAAELLEHARNANLPISQIVFENEKTMRSEKEIRERILKIWHTMQACVEKGCHADGILPGGLKVKRRAPELFRQLSASAESTIVDPLAALDWVDLYALAVNEENAAAGRVVTAPTNGAAGIVPAVLHFHQRFYGQPDAEKVICFLLTAGAIAMLYKKNASISGAEVGCQGEVGVACSMAAGALAEVLGGTIDQVEMAAEIGMEHNLGLTCDPIGGLVQIPCIERNAMGAVKAINAARMALRSDGKHHVSLDRVIRVMRRTGADMSKKYKETSLGGLAVNFSEC